MALYFFMLCVFVFCFFLGHLSHRKSTSPTSQHVTFIETMWTVCGGLVILFFLRQVKRNPLMLPKRVFFFLFFSF